jgi:hypothetical protein
MCIIRKDEEAWWIEIFSWKEHRNIHGEGNDEVKRISGYITSINHPPKKLSRKLELLRTLLFLKMQ